MTWSRCPGSPISKVKRAGRHPVARRGLHGCRQDVDVVIGDHPGDVREQPVAVEGLDLEWYEENAARLTGPTSTSMSRSRLRRSESALVQSLAVDRHAVATGDEADDGVAGHRGAAAGELDPHVRRCRRRRRPGRLLRTRLRARDGTVASARSSLVASSPRAWPRAATRRAGPRRGPRRRRRRGCRCRSSAARSATAVRLSADISRCSGRPCLRRSLGDRVLALLDRLLAAFLGEPLRILLRARGLARTRASPATGRRRRP
jgi:hypothetical protein